MLLEVIVAGGVWASAQYFKSGQGDKQKLDRIFRKCGLCVKYDGKEDTPKLVRSNSTDSYTDYVYRIPEGLGLKDFISKQQVIEDSLNSSSGVIGLEDIKQLDLKGDLKKQFRNIKGKKNALKEVSITFNKVLTIRVYSEKIKDRYDYHKDILNGLKDWEVPIGYTREGLIKHDMQKHMIVAGATDFGKTNTIKMIITSLLERRPNDTILTLIDLKGGLAFSRFKEIPQLNSLATDLDSAKAALINVKDQLQGVFNYLQTNGYEDVKEAGINKRHFIIIDECAELSSSGEKNSELKAIKIECEEIMSHIARLGRAAGFYVVYSTQYPTSDVLSTQIKQQCDARICLRVKNDYASKVVIDQEGAEKLPQIKGRAIYQTHENITLQIPYVSNEYIEGVIGNVK